MKYFAYDKYNNEFETFKTEKEAKDNAEAWLEYYRQNASCEGWCDDLNESIGYGKLIATTVEKVIAEKKNFTDEEWEEKCFGSDFDKIIDYKLKPIDARL